MKTTLKISSALLAATLLFSCSCKKDNGVVNPKDSELKISATGINWLRTMGNTWSAGDAIGIYAVTPGSELSDANLYQQKPNVKFVTEGGNGTFTHADAPIVLPQTGHLDIIAYYPYNADIADYKYTFNCTDQADPSKIDLLYAKSAGVSAQNPTAQMSFNHVLTVLDIKLNPKGHDLGQPTITFKDVLVDGTFSIIDGSVTTGTATGNPSLILKEKNDAGLILGSIILPPQSFSGKKLSLQVGDKEMLAEIPDLETKSGFRYNVEINYDAENEAGAKLRVSTANINDWNTGESIPVITIVDANTTVEVSEITLSQTTANIKIGEELVLTYKIMPDNATDKTVTWQSSDSAVATVDNGTVRAVAAGQATITATSKNGKQATCIITVKVPNPDQSIPDVPGENL